MNPAFDFIFFSPNRYKIESQFNFILAILLMLSNFPTISDFFFSPQISFLLVLLSLCSVSMHLPEVVNDIALLHIGGDERKRISVEGEHYISHIIFISPFFTNNYSPVCHVFLFFILLRSSAQNDVSA